MFKVNLKSKKFLLLLTLLMVIFAIIIYFEKQSYINSKYKNFAVIDYKLEGKNYRLLVADNPQKWEQGLMFYRNLDGFSGMIFIFPDKAYRTFWNKNTLVDLQMIWLSDDRVVGKSALPSIDKSKEIVTVNSPAPVNKVIELL